jgi:hypothetical protein
LVKQKKNILREIFINGKIPSDLNQHKSIVLNEFVGVQDFLEEQIISCLIKMNKTD